MIKKENIKSLKLWSNEQNSFEKNLYYKFISDNIYDIKMLYEKVHAQKNIIKILRRHNIRLRERLKSERLKSNDYEMHRSYEKFIEELEAKLKLERRKNRELRKSLKNRYIHNGNSVGKRNIEL